MKALLAWLTMVAMVTLGSSLDNGMGRVPPMGVNTWNSLRCTRAVNAENIKSYAESIVEKGLDSKGFRALIIDDCWSMPERDPATGKLRADPVAFPDGMRAVADYVHGLNLSLGMYSDRGTKTCAGRPGSGGHERIDAEYFANDVGIDVLKYDSCSATSDRNTAFAEYGRMRDALNATGRKVLYQVCGWNAWYAPKGEELGNTWRIAADADDWLHIYRGIRTNEALSKYAGPGHYNDPDMLVGSGRDTAVFVTPQQSRTQFNLWAIMASPLIIGASLTNMTEWDLETYSNERVISVNQDSLGIQGIPIYSDCPPVGKPYVPLEQSSPTTFPLNITPWTWAWSRLLEVTIVSVCVVLVCLLVLYFLWTRRAYGWSCCCPSSNDSKRLEFAVLKDESKHPYDTVGNHTDNLSPHLNSSRRVTSFRANDSEEVPCRHRTYICCLVVTFIFTVLMFILTVWLIVILSWGVDSCTQVWAKPLTSGVGGERRVAIAMVNYGLEEMKVRCNAECLNKAGFKSNEFNNLIIEDLWNPKNLYNMSGDTVVCTLDASEEGGTSCMLLLQA